jgi:probable HAF family extracellular repeat protein
MSLRIGLVTTIAVGLLTVASPATATDFSFVTFDVPGSVLGSTTAKGINNDGQIVGFFTSGGSSHGYIYTDGDFMQIDVPATFGFSTRPNSINDAGDIVGFFAVGPSGGSTQGFLDVGGTFTTLVAFGSGITQPHDINNVVQIVGTFSGPTNRAFLYSGGSFAELVVPGGNLTDANGINDAGQIVGRVDLHGFLFSDGIFTTIDVPGAGFTAANGINNAGQIVGIFGDSGGTHGFLYSGGIFTTIDVPGAARFTAPRGINDAGLIVGDFESSFGVNHGFLATPVTESSSFALTSIGLIGLNFVRRRRWTLELKA